MTQIFLTGVGRSGTTLLQSILESHDKIKMLPESHYIIKYITYDRGELLVDKKFIETLENDHEFSRLNFELNDSHIGKTRTDLYTEILRNNRIKYGVDYIGDKDPSFCDVVDELKKIDHDSYLIHIIRDPRDVILSRVKSGWGKSIPFVEHVYRYNRDIIKAKQSGGNIFNSKYIEVYYEDLLSKPNSVCNEVCNRLNIPFSTNMLQHSEYGTGLYDENEAEWKSNVSKPIMKNNIGKWLTGLTTSQIKIIESYCSYAFETLPYQKSTSARLGILKFLVPIYYHFCRTKRRLKRKLSQVLNV